MKQKNFELANFQRMDSKFLHKISDIENVELIKSSLKKGKGILFVSAHAGNCEMVTATVAGLDVPVNVVAKRYIIDELNDMLVGYRASKKVNIIFKDTPGTGIKQ
ncbi:MAG: hypothetical protein LE178_00120 [Endomicrobium sp.]|jgi:lauroyl/myristoyl acyltransferase|nr:hypothetical protein [Endomicrobium sp.]